MPRSMVRHRSISALFFFFQAEDGIRDLTVTGVQTCALPIYPILAAYGVLDQACMSSALLYIRMFSRRACSTCGPPQPRIPRAGVSCPTQAIIEALGSDVLEIGVHPVGKLTLAFDPFLRRPTGGKDLVGLSPLPEKRHSPIGDRDDLWSLTA